MSIYATYREHGHSGAVLPASDGIASTNLVRAAAGTPRLADIATEGNRAGLSRTDRERCRSWLVLPVSPSRPQPPPILLVSPTANISIPNPHPTPTPHAACP